MFDGLTGLAAVFYLFFFVLTAVCAVGGLFCLRYDLHMLQLSSYQFQGYFRSLRTKPRVWIAGLCSLIGLTSYAVLPGRAADGWLLAIGAVESIYLFLPGKAKKKFVVTARIKRLIVLLALLFAATLLLCGLWARRMRADDFLPFVALFLAEGSWLTVHTFIVAFANLLAKPVEKAVQNWYINDAKRLLREHPGLRVIGITGSFGKTSVKHYLTEVLSEKYSVLMTPGSFNTPMGVVRTIREQLRPTHEIFVCEMGARHVGDIREICDIVHPHDGILTAIGDQHLETFHTRENIIRTKYELLDAVEAQRENGGAFPADAPCLKFVNGDDGILAENRKYADAITYGLRSGNDCRGEILSVDASGTTFRATVRNVVNRTTDDAEDAASESEIFTVPLVGRHNVVNVLGAIAVAHALGVPLAKCRMAARRLQPAAHRLEIRKAPYGAILDDAYNSNPAGAQAALETLAAVAAGSGSGAAADASENVMLKILVTPGMVELGEKQAAYNQAFGRQAADVCDYIFTVGRTNSEALRRGALEAGFDAERLFACATLAEATEKMVALEAGRARVVLLENDLPDDY